MNPMAEVAKALRDGRLVRETCTCGVSKVEAHHVDYNRPLDVVWLCSPCHKKEHARLRREGISLTNDKMSIRGIAFTCEEVDTVSYIRMEHDMCSFTAAVRFAIQHYAEHLKRSK